MSVNEETAYNFPHGMDVKGRKNGFIADIRKSGVTINDGLDSSVRIGGDWETTISASILVSFLDKYLVTAV